ncbi:DUF4230 domain-containing protein [Segetibacter sp. 3557_3]|uniref:DUF4230 domain-containing protein n=1 Tax=Segetibacter sp. 3557_3 TaxID=2547429 RepID=UPI0010583CA1|nr:DUF4230 domain-containing protein [Segetibacter sp. 3557_3]TDH21240.1 DUF4230 domain-containing protein [Segetibacter sp. 3557_3]
MKRLRVRRFIYIILAIFIGVWIIKRGFKLPSLRNPFAEQPVVIDQTPIVIKQVRSIAQLVTVTVLDEVVVDSVVVNKSSAFANVFNRVTAVPMLPITSRRLVLICKGKVLAGTELNLVNRRHVSIKNDSIFVQIPPAKILDLITNPSDFETFEETGSWTPDAVVQVKLKARKRLHERAIQRQILQRANTKAIQIVSTLLQNSGYRYVSVSVSS